MHEDDAAPGDDLGASDRAQRLRDWRAQLLERLTVVLADKERRMDLAEGRYLDALVRWQRALTEYHNLSGRISTLKEEWRIS